MLFNSLEFLIFLPIVFLLFWICPKKVRWAVLLLASYAFYMYWNWKLIFLILFTTVISYVAGLLLERFKDRKGPRIASLVIAIVACFGVLLFFKYFTFLADVCSDIRKAFTGQGIHGYFDIMLPVGISFYTFQTASYVIDVYKGKFQAEKHFGYYALFVTFFPQLVAGPIERPENLLPQLKAACLGETKIKDLDYWGSLRYMMVGFFKKIAIADIIGICVNSVYNNLSASNGPAVLVATLLFAVQIFCDFSGYSDIAVGCAKLFGVNLTENFNNPYGAKNIKDFWGRWHISLSKWLRDYIYFPLGGSRVKKWRWVMNVMIVFFISGLWHGANYTFIIWGLLHGAFQVIGVLTLRYRNAGWRKLKVNPDGKAISILRIIGTFLLVDFCWVFFRANNLADAGTALTKIFTDWNFDGSFIDTTASALSMNLQSLIYIVIILGTLPFLEWLKRGDAATFHPFRFRGVRYPLYYAMAIVVAFAWIYLQASNVGSSFVYFQF